ncbi:MAG: hypothetical protein WKG07_09265 [Hymenobacter sp.]
MPDEAGEAKVLAALRALQQETPFYLESDLAHFARPSATPAAWQQRLQDAEASADVSYEDARRLLGLCE